MAAQKDPLAPDPMVGRAISNGRYQVVDRLASGGMGVVYRAEQLPLGRPVALKLLELKHSPEIDDSFRQRFFLEAAAAAKLSHPNTIVVYDYGESEGLYYIAMEYLKGGTLDEHLKTNGPLTPQQAIHVSMQVCSSLRDAHESQLVHRDLKPGNIMFSPRARDPFFVKVLDFGLVKVVSGDDKDSLGLTQSGVVMGSPRYMAPEQVRATPVDNRTDIYSFGAVLYHMLAGAPPFAAGKAFDAMTAHVTTPPPPLKQTRPDCPAGPKLEALVMRCLQKQPQKRFQDMDEVIIALSDCYTEVGGPLSSGSTYLTGQSLPGIRLESEDSDPSRPKPDVSGPQPSGALLKMNQEPSDANLRVPAGALPEAVAMPQLPPPPPRQRSALPMFAVGGLLVVGMSVGLGVGFWPSDEPAERPAPVAAPEPPPPQPEPTPAEPQIAPVMVESDPAGATVRRQGHDLGDTPQSLPIPRGESWEIEVSLEGYQSRTVTVLGGQPSLAIRLRPVAQEAAPPTKTGRRGGGRPQGGGSDHPDLTDPWSN